MAPTPPSSSAVARATNEHRLGIIHHVSSVDFGWYGEIRKRYTDFIVNEVRRDGTVLHLTDYDVTEEPKKPSTTHTGADSTTVNEDASTAAAVTAQTSEPEVPQISEEDLVLLERVLGTPTTTALTELYTRAVKGENASGPTSSKITFPPIAEKAERGLVHREIRRIFGGQIETQTDDSGVITATSTVRVNRRARGKGRQSGPRNARGGRGRGADPDFGQLGGDYLHFTLYKENKDTMEAINHIARMLKIKSSNFSFAGTKDRRAATTQRACAQRVRKESLDWLNSRAVGYRLGDCKYQPQQINLGDHGGNEFVIVVKDCKVQRAEGCSVQRKVQMLQQSVSLGLANIMKNGFLNYFGLQRFGTHMIGTQEVGTMILTENFEKAVDALLYVEPDVAAHAFSEDDATADHNKDQYARARGISIWRSSGNANAALKYIPRRFSAESSIIQHLGRNESTRRDFCGAILTITRGMRQLYIHAYQSRVWNFAASKRWERYGNKVVKGDLVLANPNSSGDLDEEDEISTAGLADPHERARTLTAEEAESGKYTIFDVILPLPGFDVLYPDNDIGTFYVELMALPEYGGLDPHNMRRRQREFSLSGSYRKVMARFVGEPSGEARAYRDDNEQMHPTDLDLIEKRKAAEKKESAENQSEEKRRYQGESASSSAPNLRNGDTWVQQGNHGTSKRLKVAQASSSGSTQEGTSNGSASFLAASDPSGQEMLLHDAVGNSAGSSDVNPNAGSTEPLRQPTAPSSLETKGFSDSGLVAAPMPVDGHNDGWGTIDADSPFLRELGRSAQQHPFDGRLGQSNIGQPFTPSPLAQSQYQQPFDGALPANPPDHTFGFHGAQALQIVSGTIPGSDNLDKKQAEPTKTTDTSAKPYDNATRRNSITVAPKADEITEDMKLAVILKFQLRSSNYATIALRELMGIMDPDVSEDVISQA